ncbi:MAG: pyridoxamine 5'-phosphate oxidase [Candidatus Portiera sp.]|nr:pyridoxamine 5'-phosphate oxidase [Portiera sp.]
MSSENKIDNKIDVAKMASSSRREYIGDNITLDTTPAEPFGLFIKWLEDAMQRADIQDGNAMCLSTLSQKDSPHSRMVLLKDVEYGDDDKEHGFVFYTNYEGNKAQEIETNPAVALNFWWPPIYRQVRIEGKAYKLDRLKTQKYFATRDRGSQIGAWASPQSRQISSYEELTARVKEIEDRFDGEEVPVPPHWGGYIVCPSMIEFWQGSPSRLHSRIIYRQQVKGAAWDKIMLAP